MKKEGGFLSSPNDVCKKLHWTNSWWHNFLVVWWTFTSIIFCKLPLDVVSHLAQSPEEVHICWATAPCTSQQNLGSFALKQTGNAHGNLPKCYFLQLFWKFLSVWVTENRFNIQYLILFVFWWGFFHGHLVAGQIKIYSTSKGVTAKSVANSSKSIFYKALFKMDYQHWQRRKWAAAFFTIYILNFTIWWPCEVFGDYCNKTLLLFRTYFATDIIGFSLGTDVTCLRYNSERMHTEERICFCKEDIR